MTYDNIPDPGPRGPSGDHPVDARRSVPSAMREFEIKRTDFPSIFIFEGKAYMEYYDSVIDKTVFLPIKRETLERELGE